MPARAAAGFTLVEMTVVATLVTVMALLAWTALGRASARLRVEMAAQEIAGALRLARIEAIRHGTNCAVRFRQSGERWSWSLYLDGDGDGVLSRDIERGVDPLHQTARPLRQLGGEVHLGVPPGVPPRDPGNPRRRLRRPEDPIRLGRSDMASFDAYGGSSPGSVYLTDGRRWTAAVRLDSRAGRVRVIVYDGETEEWR